MKLTYSGFGFSFQKVKLFFNKLFDGRLKFDIIWQNVKNLEAESCVRTAQSCSLLILACIKTHTFEVL